jgi:hypothetical protein
MDSNQDKLMASVWGGIVIGLISGIPVLNLINCACCAGVIAGGVFAIYMYRRSVGDQIEIGYGDGALLGLLAGLIGAIISTLLSTVFNQASFEMMRYFMDYVDDPEAREMLRELSAREMTTGLMLVGLFFSILVNGIFGLVGGLLGVAFFGKSRPGSPDVTPSPQGDESQV